MEYDESLNLNLLVCGWGDNADGSLRGKPILTSLHMASFYGLVDITRDLLAMGVKIGTPVFRYGINTALGIAVRRGHVQMVRFLLQMGAGASLVRDCASSTWESELRRAVESGNISIVQAFIDVWPKN